MASRSPSSRHCWVTLGAPTTTSLPPAISRATPLAFGTPPVTNMKGDPSRLARSWGTRWVTTTIGTPIGCLPPHACAMSKVRRAVTSTPALRPASSMNSAASRVLRELRRWLDALDTAHPEEHMLERYVTAIASERAQAASDPGWAIGRRIRLQRQLPAPVSEVWTHWTSPALVRQWWSPEHFDVAECDIDPAPGGRLEITMRAPDGGRYPIRGHFLTVTPHQRLRFELSHLAADEARVFTAIHDLHLTDHGQRTQLNLAIRVTAAI
jgi:uncharacterized protein YndB with AHSA1/START domain